MPRGGVGGFLGSHRRQRSSPRIGRADAGVPGREERAIRGVEEEVAAYVALPGVDARHRGRILADQDVLVEEIAVDDVAPLRTGVEQVLDPRDAGEEETL